MKIIQTTPEIEGLVTKLVDFVITNRTDKIFKNWSREEIERALRAGILNESLCYATNESGEVNGIVHWILDPNKKLMYVVNVLTTDRSVLPVFMDRFDNWFPGYKLAGMRYGVRKEYNTPRFQAFFNKGKQTND